MPLKKRGRNWWIVFGVHWNKFTVGHC
jgi:hypothetical protein